jgi:outer membrane receptor protein involved in Fe transport
MRPPTALMSSRRRIRTAALALFAVLLPAVHPTPARAATVQDEDLLEALGDVALFVETEILVAGATRRVAKLSEAPGTITVIDGAKLEEWGALTLEEALRYVTSVTFSPGSISLTTNIRDIEQPFANKVLLLIDGRIVNSVFRGNHFVDLSQPIDAVARVEVVRGPGSALYGANAFAGFINVVTKRGDEVEGVDGRVTIGSDGLRHGAFLAGDRKGDYNWLVDARYAESDGQDLVNPDEPNTGHRDFHVSGHWGKGSSKGETWFARVDVTDVEAGVPGTFDFKTPGDALEEQRLAFDGFRLWEPSSKTKLKLRGYYNTTSGTYAFERSAADLVLLGDQLLARTPRFYAFDDLSGRAQAFPNPNGDPDDPDDCPVCDDFALGIDPSQDPVGAGDLAGYDDLVANGLPTVVDSFGSDEYQGFLELQADWQINKNNYLLGGLSARVDDVDNGIVGERGFENYAFFIEDEQRFLRNKLILLGSLRLDDHSYFGLTVSPRVSLIWSPNDKLILKTAYGKAFRSPNFVELFGSQRMGTASLFGAERAVEEGVMPATFERCLDEGVSVSQCDPNRLETLQTELEQEEISSVELWTEYTPNDKFKVILNLYWFEIENEVGVALDRSDVWYYLNGNDSRDLFGGPRAATFVPIPDLQDVPTFGVFLNAPDTTRGYGGELELHVDPFEWVNVQLKYSRRDTEKGEVREFVEADDLSDTPQLVPTFGTRRFLTDSLTGLMTFRAEDSFWASLRFRLLGRPGNSFIAGGESLTSDLTLGYRAKNFTVSGTVLNLNEGGVLFDPERDDFVDGDADYRLSVGYRKSF